MVAIALRLVAGTLTILTSVLFQGYRIQQAGNRIANHKTLEDGIGLLMT